MWCYTKNVKQEGPQPFRRDKLPCLVTDPATNLRRCGGMGPGPGPPRECAAPPAPLSDL